MSAPVSSEAPVPVEVDRPFESSLERVSPVAPPEGGVAGSPRAATYVLPHEWNASAAAVNRLLAQQTAGRPAWAVRWAAEPFKLGAATRVRFAQRPGRRWVRSVTRSGPILGIANFADLAQTILGFVLSEAGLQGPAAG